VSKFCDLRIASFSPQRTALLLGPCPGTIAASIGPDLKCSLFGLIRGNQQNVTSQIASKFAIDAFINVGTKLGRELSSELCVQEGLREANKKVYEYSNKMLSASRISTTGLFTVFDGENCSVARTGDEQGYLFRGGELTPLFKHEGELSSKPRIERFIGANKQLLADIATLKVKTGDVIWVTNTTVPSLRTVSDVRYEDLYAEDIAAELVARLRDVAPRTETVICATLLFDTPPIVLKRAISE